MSILPLSFGSAALALFLAALALVPLVIMWRDARGRAKERARLARLREQARLNHRLHSPAAAAAQAGLRVPGE